METPPEATIESSDGAHERDATPAVVMRFDDFYVRHHARIERALILTIGDRELGYDAASEAFVRALSSWREVAEFSNPAGWVFRVGLNWARSRQRRRRREVHPEEYLRLVAADVTSDARVDDGQLESVEDDVVLSAALARLSVEHRAVIVGRFYLDWTEADLAETLAIPAGTVKSRSSRALTLLAAHLKDER